MSPSSQPPRLSFSPDLEPPTPTYSPNSATTSPRSSSVRGNSFQVLGYSSNPRSEASTPSPREAQRDSFDERKRHSKRSNTTNENGYADEKSKRDSYRFSMDELRKSFIDVKHLRRPINYSYIGTIVLHVVLLLFFSIVTGVKGLRKYGFDTEIPPLNLDIKQSAINLVTGGFGVMLTALIASLAQKAATNRLFERRQDLTYLSDGLSAWVGPFAALKSLINHATEQVKQNRMTLELALISIYLIFCALMGAIFTSIFTLGVYNTSVTTLAQMVPWDQIASANISTAGFFGAGRWNTMASSVYTNQLQNQTHLPGVNHNRMYSYLDTQSSSISGTVMSPATDLNVTCKSVHDIDLEMSAAPDILSKSVGYPIILEGTFQIDGNNHSFYDMIPWKPCSEWADTDLAPIRSRYLQSSLEATLVLEHPTSFILHYSCTKDPAPQDCPLNGCKPLRDAVGVWAHTIELFPLIGVKNASPNSTNVDTSIIANNNWTTSKQATSDSQGNLKDFGLGLSVLACTASSAAAADPVKVSLPENTIEDFPNPADKIQSRKWSVYNEPPSDPDHLNNSLFRFPDMLNPYGAPLFAAIANNKLADNSQENSDPNSYCFGMHSCYPTTLVEHYIYSQMGGIQGNTNELAGLELALQNVTATALSSAASFIRNAKSSQELNPGLEDQTANMRKFQNFVLPAQKTVQRTKLSLNKWPLVIGMVGSSITLVIAFLLLRPLPEGTPFVKGSDLIHITRLLSLSDIPERMRNSPSDFHGMRQHGRFPTRLDGDGSTLMSEAALLSSSISPSSIPIISPSRTGFGHSISFRDKNAKSGLDLVEA